MTFPRFHVGADDGSRWWWADADGVRLIVEDRVEFYTWAVYAMEDNTYGRTVATGEAVWLTQACNAAFAAAEQAHGRCERCRLPVVEWNGLRVAAPINGKDIAYEPHHCSVDELLRNYVAEAPEAGETWPDVKWLAWRRWQERRQAVRS